MKLLVLGGCGYKGTALTQALLSDGHEVTVVDAMWFGNHLPSHERLTVMQADIRQIDEIPMEGFNAIIHLANVANDPCGDLNSKLVWEVNALATMQLAEKAIASGIEQLIFASSGSVYGVKEEEKVTEDLSLLPISDYNKTKMIAERVLMSYQDKLCVQIVRPATVCGYSPRMRLDLSVNMLTMQALTQGEITVFGGKQTRPNIHLKDMVRVYQHFLSAGTRLSGVYNAGFENISILDIANMVAEKIPAKVTIQDLNDPRSYRLCSEKLLATGYAPEYGVKKAIEELTEQYAAGILEDRDAFYNIRTMKAMAKEAVL